jgi:hypothetical protein
MRPRRPEDVRAWLQEQPSLIELQEAYPGEWAVVQRELADVVPRANVEELKSYVTSLSQGPAPARQRKRSKQGQAALLSEQIRHQMAVAAVKQLSLSAATGVTEGRLRFNLVNGWVAQKLLFEQDLRRKPVSLLWFRLIWPLLWQRRFLMPLVGPKGIYCFYSSRLISRLAAMIGDSRCLEIAAGDGTLSRFLSADGVDVTATDDHSWHDVQFPASVLRQDACEALRAHQPEVVICSWPPAGNAFERDVFTTDSVQLYVVISSRHAFASGDWAAYEGQTDVEFAEDEALSRLVLPPELEAAVYVFRRRAG